MTSRAATVPIFFIVYCFLFILWLFFTRPYASLHMIYFLVHLAGIYYQLFILFYFVKH